MSQLADTFEDVIQYNLDRVLSNDRFQRTEMLNRSLKILLIALATLQAHHLTKDSQILEFVFNIQVKTLRRVTNFARSSQENCLYQAEYDHDASNTCINCDRFKQISRLSRNHNESIIHYELIASANHVVKDDRL
jgi:hypothetical protein